MKSEMGYEIIELASVVHENEDYGGISFLEFEKDVPFQIKRFYYIYDTKKSMCRGYHAHKDNIQFLSVPYGEIDVIVDDGKKRDTIKLNKPSKGLILNPGLWREMIWKKSNSVLCVCASEYYDPNEYIRDYSEFLKWSEKCQKVSRVN